jgi:hypothetical protein
MAPSTSPQRAGEKMSRRPVLIRRFPKMRWQDHAADPLIDDADRAAYPELGEDFALLDDKLVPRFQHYDQLALKHQNSFRLQQVLLIIGGLAATALGALLTIATSRSWRGVLGLAEAFLAAFLAAVAFYAKAQGSQSKYLGERLKAERLRAEFFLFLSRAVPYITSSDPGRLLEQRVVDIDTEEQS